jgi:hypothetical protein
MHHSTMFDQNGDPCLMVIKHGNTTCLTIGYINDIFYARNYYGNNSETCKERAIFPFGTKSIVFSAEDDSGSAIVDGFGRIISANSSPAVPTPRLPRTRASILEESISIMTKSSVYCSIPISTLIEGRAVL